MALDLESTVVVPHRNDGESSTAFSASHDTQCIKCDSASLSGHCKMQPPRRGRRMDSLHSESRLQSRISVGKQMELEAKNAIKYRTCSWQKVRHEDCT